MDASSTLRVAWIPSGAARILALALLAGVFLLGGTGGYFVRDLNFSWPATSVTTTTITDHTTRPFVIESPPSYATTPASTAEHGPDSDLTRAQPGQGESLRASE